MKTLLFISETEIESTKKTNIFKLLSQIPENMLPKLDDDDLYIKICVLHNKNDKDGYYIQYDELMRLNQQVKRNELYFDIIVFYDVGAYLLNAEDDLVDFHEEYEYFINPQNWMVYNENVEDKGEEREEIVYNMPLIILYDFHKDKWSFA